ncbi:ABC transporter permease [Paenibacillus filicis]|uniref:ABC transporter permease n=1 Tax=Paenibacillus filicis TaxID=669464 RepID=UPI003119FB17
MHAFRRLLVTELRNRRNTIVVAAGAILFLHAAILILTYHSNPQADGFASIMVLNIALFALVLQVPFLHSFSAWREEWRQRAIYQLLMLPVPRVYLLLSKGISLLLETLLLSLVMLAGLWVQYELSGGLLLRAEPLTTFAWSKVLLIYNLLICAASVIFLSTMSMLLGKRAGKFSLLVTFLSFAAGLFLAIVAFANLPTEIGLTAILIVLFLFNWFLLEKKVDIR